MTRGLSAIGLYVPRRRLSRRAISEALAWRQQAVSGRGERSYGQWDEDALTYAVEAGRHALAPGAPVEQLILASTTAPFADRSNAGLAAEALGLQGTLRTQDVGGSQRAATSALIALLEGRATTSLLLATDRRRTKPGSPQESAYGDGAVAVRVDDNASLAEYLGSASHAVDFVDHYREAGQSTDYALEERWVRSQAWNGFVRQPIEAVLANAGVAPADVSHVILPTTASVADPLLRSLGFAASARVDALYERIGDTGVAQPLLQLAAVLETCAPGALILVVGFGQGADAILLRASAVIDTHRPVAGVSAALAGGQTDTSYVRFLAATGVITMDAGMRAERDARTAHSTHYRKHDVINGFMGGRCSACATVQFPPAPACVNPECRAFAPQSPVRLADVPGRIKTYTEDWLAYTPAPPLVYGNVAFEGGGNAFIDFTDVDPGEAAVGAAVRFVFRIKDVDATRGFHRYFWKATLRRP
jgi:3-hydroxy-3-methylglutaryl CoA synthase